MLSRNHSNSSLKGFGVFLLIASILQCSAAECLKEFETCVMNRDCCDGLHCAMGDWSVTTDSTCLSERSEKLNALNVKEKVEMITKFYGMIEDANKTPEEAEKLTTKYAGRREFAQLVVRLERKYRRSVEDGRELGRDEL